MTCKDCIYEKMCESRYEREHCLSFKDKANFVEVVRCKDCKHIETTEYGGYCCLKKIGVAYNDYCGYGERREE